MFSLAYKLFLTEETLQAYLYSIIIFMKSVVRSFNLQFYPLQNFHNKHSFSYNPPPHSLSVLKSKHKFHKQSFFPRIAHLWNSVL